MDHLKCPCGFQAKTHEDQTQHMDECQLFQEESKSLRKAMFTRANDGPRGEKRRHFEDPSTPIAAVEKIPGVQGPIFRLFNPLDDDTDSAGESDIAPSSRPSHPKRNADKSPAPGAPMGSKRATEPFITPPDKFGLFRVYDRKPTYVPDLDINSMSEPPKTSDKTANAEASGVARPEYYPFPNYSQYLFAKWAMTREHGTLGSFDQFLDCLRDPRFKKQDMEGLTYNRMMELLSASANDEDIH